MSTRIGVFLLALTWALLITPLGIALGKRYNVQDKPGGRKKHEGVVPLGGGWTLFSGFLLWSLTSRGLTPGARWIVTGLTLVFIVGYLDDMKPLGALPRLVMHAIAASFAVMAVPGLAMWQRLIFFLWISGMTSAFNLIDGMNGLSLSMALIFGAVWLLFSGSLQWAFLVGGCLGVLFWNYPRCRTFLGDGGSTFLGYFCGAFALLDSPQIFGAMGPVRLCVALALFGGIPVIDTLLAMSRRILCGVSPFCPDRGHLHHRLLDRNWSVSAVLVVLGVLQGACILIAFDVALRTVGIDFGHLARLLEVIV